VGVSLLVDFSGATGASSDLSLRGRLAGQARACRLTTAGVLLIAMHQPTITYSQTHRIREHRLSDSGMEKSGDDGDESDGKDVSMLPIPWSESVFSVVAVYFGCRIQALTVCLAAQSLVCEPFKRETSAQSGEGGQGDHHTRPGLLCHRAVRL
jgi:hypothetical protein